MPNWKKVITSGSDAILNTLQLSGVVNANTDTDKFLVLDSSGNVDFRTGANVLSDIGAVSTSHTHTLADITDVTATTAEVNKLDGVTATTAEINYVDGVTSNIQTQLNGKASTSHNHTLDSLSNTTITSNTSGEILKWNGSAWVNNTLAEAGIQAAGSYLTTGTNFGGDVSGTFNNIQVGNDTHTHNANNLTGTTLASGVVNSSLTSVGTITTGTWQGSAISTTYIQNLSGINTGDEPDASITVKGIVELATNAEADAGTDTTRAVTPSGLSLALGNFKGSSNISTVGNVTTGTWLSTDIGLAYGGTGASLADPNDDRILFWDDSDGSVAWLDIGSGLSITNQTISATATGGSDSDWYDGTTYISSSVEVRVTGSFNVFKSGSTVMAIDGSQGRLFEVTDQLSGSLFAVNDISGIPIFEVFSDDTVKIGTHNTEGLIVYGDYAQFQNGAAATPSIRFVGANADTGFYSATGDTINATTNGVQRMTLNNNGMKLNNGALGVGTANASTIDGRIDASNDIVAYSSDKRLKENIKLIQNPLSKIDSLSGFTYNWNETAEEVAGYDRTQSMVGVFAQDVESVLPEAVKRAPFDNDGNDGSISGENYLTVQYEKLVPLLIESIKELKAEIEELKGRH